MKSLVEVINEGIPQNIFVNALKAKSQRDFGKELSKLNKYFKSNFRVFETSNKLPDVAGYYCFVAFDPMWGQMIYGNYKENYVIGWDRDKNIVSNKYVGPAKFFSETLDIYDAEYQLGDVIQDLKYNAENAPY